MDMEKLSVYNLITQSELQKYKVTTWRTSHFNLFSILLIGEKIVWVAYIFDKQEMYKTLYKEDIVICSVVI